MNVVIWNIAEELKRINSPYLIIKKNFTKRVLSENVVEIIFQFLIHYYDKAAWLATVSF